MRYNIILLTNLANDNGLGNRRYVFFAEADTPEEAGKILDTGGEWFVIPGFPEYTRIRSSCIQVVEIVEADNQNRGLL